MMIEVEELILTGNVRGVNTSRGCFSGNGLIVNEYDQIILGDVRGVNSSRPTFAGNNKEISEFEDFVRGGIVHQNPGVQTVGALIQEVFQGATYPKAGDNMRLIDYLEDPKPEADFTSNRVDGIAPFAVQFIDTSTNNPIAWKWNFGDGHVSNAQNPVHSFLLPGKYSITLRVYTYTQSDLTIKFDYILAGILDFQSDHTSGPVKLKCRFNAEIVLP